MAIIKKCIEFISNAFDAMGRGLERVFLPAIAGLAVYAFVSVTGPAIATAESKVKILSTEVVMGSDYQFHGRRYTDEYVVTTFSNGVTCYRLGGYPNASCIKP